MAHDGLNRPVKKTYTSGGSVVHYSYDSCANGIGRQCGVSVVGGTSLAYAYDLAGRVVNSSQTTDGTTYPFSYTYNAAGGLEMTTLPSGRTITQCYDRAGRAKSVTSAKPGGQTQTYMSQASYDAGGGINQALLGNGKWLDWDYNERKQVTSIKLGSAAGAGDVLTLGYSFGTTNNNGNVVSQTITRPSFWATQNYGYDALNRVNSVTEGTESRTFDYTPTGSMWVVGASANFTASSFTPRSSAWFDANNRLVNVGLSINYDAAGNQTGIGGYSNTYDAENRLVTSTLNGITTNYVYDGEGRRVKKGAMVMTYDAFGNLAAEYGGTMTEFGTRYLTTDHLGSTRLVTDASGAAKQCRDYLPFGEEIAQGVGGRPSCYAAASKPRLKFTGKERDVETGLDYFGARYFSGAQGRFTSPDPKMFPSAFDDPQSWNKYGYTRNNPLRYVDPDGEDWRDALKGAINGFTSSNTLNAGRIQSSNSDFRFGQAIGDAVATVQGAIEVLAGTGGGVSGTALDLTGVGAVLGVPVNVVSAGAIGHGGTVATTGLANLGITLYKNSTEGNYEFPDAKNPGKTYVGQSGNVEKRLAQHEKNGKLAPSTDAKVTEVPGGKTAREVAEQKRINQLGGTRNNPGSQTSNERNPIGKRREKKMEDEYGPLKD